MTDLASLGIRVESQEADVADQRLDDLAASAARAEKGVDGLANAARRADGATQTMNVAVREQSRYMAVARNGMGLTAAEGLNLGRQFADIGVTAAMGMNPLMIAIQQGPQLLDIFTMAAIRTGTTVRVAMMTAASAAAAALVPFLPLIAVVGTLAAVVGGTLALATRAANQEIGTLKNGMNLSEAQMKRLKEEGTSTAVNLGDVFRGAGTTIKEMFVDTFGDQIDWMKDRWTEFLDGAARLALSAVKGIGTAFLGTFYAIQDTWRMLPAVIGDAAVSAANMAIRATEAIVNRASQGINTILAGLRGLAAVNPTFAWARAIPNIGTASLGQLGNGNAGAMNRFGTGIGNAFGRASGVVDAGVDGILSDLVSNIRASGRARVTRDAGDAGSESGGRDRAGPRDRGEFQGLQALERVDLQPLNIQVAALLEPLELISDEMRLIDDLARDSAQGLASAFGESGRALGELLTTMTSYQSRLADIALAEQEHQLSAAQADRERAHAQIASYGDMLGAAKGFFQEGSDGYRALQAAEQAYRVFQFAMSVQAMAQNAAETGVSVGGSLARGAASAAAGAAKMFEALGPFAFPVVGAMLALLASIGLKGGGGGGSKGGAANDNAVSDSVTRSQSQSAQQDQARQSIFESVAQQVEVKVTADRDGLNAYVTQTAADTARPMVERGMAAAGGATRAQVMEDLNTGRTYSRSAG